MPLCSTCRNLPPLTEFQHVEIHHTFQDLLLSVEHGCEFCILIWQSLQGLTSTSKILAGKPDEVSVALIYPRLPISAHPDARGTYQYILVSPTTDEEAGSRIDLFTKQGEEAPEAVDGRSIAPSHDSDITFEFIDESIQECLESHKECSKNSDVALPTFLLDVRPDHDPENIVLIRNNETLRGTYLSLSYCWGGPQAVQLTKQTLDSFQKGIDLQSLPKTLQDAVHVTRRLCHRYLWIDALCIIQDDELFKQKELVQMNRIYKNSFLTIQPSVSNSVDKGFFHLRSVTSPTVKLAFQANADGTQTHVYARVLEVEPRYTYTSTRAWIFQETVLPPRLLVYGERQVFILCREQKYSEDGLHTSTWNISPRTYKRIRPDLDRKSQATPDSIRESALKTWYEMVSLHYSQRLYGVSDDRLYALLAYADEAHRPIGGRYLAGLWDMDLVRGLGWRRLKKVLNEAIKYRAPSWSWAAFDGAVIWPRSTNRSKVPGLHVTPKIVHAWTAIASASPYGACHDGILVLETLVGLASARDEFLTPQGEFDVLTADGTGDLCLGRFDTSFSPRTFLCAFLTETSGLLLVPGRKGFRRVGSFSLSFSITKRCDAAAFEAWATRACQIQTISIF